MRGSCCRTTDSKTGAWNQSKADHTGVFNSVSSRLSGHL